MPYKYTEFTSPYFIIEIAINQLPGLREYDRSEPQNIFCIFFPLLLARIRPPHAR